MQGGRGGARPGAGRPKGSKIEVASLEPASPEGELPLGYLLRIMRDSNIDPKRRDTMAKAALPYFHGRLISKSHSSTDPNGTEQTTPLEEFFRFDR
jgi:hypothetical protein